MPAPNEQPAVPETEYDRAARLLFAEHTVTERPATPGSLFKKAQPASYIISYKDAKDRAGILRALETLVIEEPSISRWKNEIVVSGERSSIAFGRQYKNYRMSHNPRWFTYENLMKVDSLLVPRDNSNKVVIGDGGNHQYIHIEREDRNMPSGRAVKPEYQSTGKFHISVEPERLAEAWDAIAERVVKGELDIDMKVVTRETAQARSNIKGGAEGKDIVLHRSRNNEGNPEEWGKLLSYIENTLESKGIKPGPKVSGEPMMDNSRGYTFGRDGDTVYHITGANAGQVAETFVPQRDSFLTKIKLHSQTSAAKPVQAPPPHRKPFRPHGADGTDGMETSRGDTNRLTPTPADRVKMKEMDRQNLSMLKLSDEPNALRTDRFDTVTSEISEFPLAKVSDGKREFFLKAVSAEQAAAHLAAQQLLPENAIVRYAKAQEISAADLPQSLGEKYQNLGEKRRLLLVESVPYDPSMINEMIGQGNGGAMDALNIRLGSKPVTAEEQIQIFKELDMLSKAGIVHGDLPANISFLRDESGKLTMHVIDPWPEKASGVMTRDRTDIESLFEVMREKGTAANVTDAKIVNAFHKQAERLADLVETEYGPEAGARIRREIATPEHAKAMLRSVTREAAINVTEQLGGIVDGYHNGAYPKAAMDMLVQSKNPNHTLELSLAAGHEKFYQSVVTTHAGDMPQWERAADYWDKNPRKYTDIPLAEIFPEADLPPLAKDADYLPLKKNIPTTSPIDVPEINLANADLDDLLIDDYLAEHGLDKETHIQDFPEETHSTKTTHTEEPAQAPKQASGPDTAHKPSRTMDNVNKAGGVLGAGTGGRRMYHGIKEGRIGEIVMGGVETVASIAGMFKPVAKKVPYLGYIVTAVDGTYQVGTTFDKNKTAAENTAAMTDKTGSVIAQSAANFVPLLGGESGEVLYERAKTSNQERVRLQSKAVAMALGKHEFSAGELLGDGANIVKKDAQGAWEAAKVSLLSQGLQINPVAAQAGWIHVKETFRFKAHIGEKAEQLYAAKFPTMRGLAGKFRQDRFDKDGNLLSKGLGDPQTGEINWNDPKVLEAVEKQFVAERDMQSSHRWTNTLKFWNYGERRGGEAGVAIANAALTELGQHRRELEKAQDAGIAHQPKDGMPGIPKNVHESLKSNLSSLGTKDFVIVDSGTGKPRVNDYVNPNTAMGNLEKAAKTKDPAGGK